MNWYEKWFNTKYYHILYANRDHEEAKLFINNLAAHLKLKKNSKIIDIACGNGRHAVYLNYLGYNVTGIDLSKKNIEIASKYFGKPFAYRPKEGFSFPLKEIFKNNHFRDPIEKEIFPQIKVKNLYDFKNILRIWQNIDKSSSSELELLFAIINFEIWINKFNVEVNN